MLRCVCVCACGRAQKGTKAEAPADAGGGDVKLMTAKKAAKKLLKKLGRKATDAEVSRQGVLAWPSPGAMRRARCCGGGRGRGEAAR